MTAIDPGRTVAVVGTGTMGQGIAQVALAAGHLVRLYDAVPGRAEEAARAIAARLGRLVDKGRLDAAGRDAALARLRPAARLAELADSALVIEAILEQLDVKQKLFGELEPVVSEDCLLATNTSSLPVTAVAGALRRPGRFVGLHFFNPAPLLPLVEVVRGFATDEADLERARATVAAWGKTPVTCADTPGFIVNRIARPFYAEAFRVYEERGADPATIDAVLRECGGFAMGPFELTDLIGQDVNNSVTRSVYEAFFHDPKFTPSFAQGQLVQAGLLGRKTGRGWFDHGEGAVRPEPSTAEPCDPPAEISWHAKAPGVCAPLHEMIEEAGVKVVRDRTPQSEWYIGLPDGAMLTLTGGEAATPQCGGTYIYFDLALDYRSCTRVALAPSEKASAADVRAAVGLFQALGKKVSVVGDVPGLIVARTVAMLVDFAEDAAGRGVADREDVDTAMRLGVNYPRGPLEWGEEIGLSRVRNILWGLSQDYPGGRYEPSLSLRRRAAVRESLL
ncbi:3-hydroxyacyl-CoA dehydrogenase [Streptomyces cinnamoneus]|uniref:3-hydroxyacyl-CoA dehydrogenase n=1 Tax=Streptomyces cinnamoneus TaxID=53446 RepID=A0A2G1XHL4_STRCJ|nr:3-hydroxyacyl-CoA dehydrogenase [Streptomyces cinnamoneus]PHQ50720.1 3-hydroxyacyl-CoA dehydrogenase [Streptomyces cinnamoneus]PPT14026.1 3-hydroxyacyl-CoA dehydrogenase [Streptomyces cinnamoneus]